MENHRLVIESKVELSTDGNCQELFILKMRMAQRMKAKQLELIYHGISSIAQIVLEEDILV